MTKKVYSDILKMAGAILGVFLYAAAFRIILVPLNLYSGGFTGISQVLMTLLEKIFHITFPTGIDFTGIFLWILNIPVSYTHLFMDKRPSNFFLHSSSVSKYFSTYLSLNHGLTTPFT